MEKYERYFDILLADLDFELAKYPDGWGLIDCQGANLGDIEQDRFLNAREIVDRIDHYIEDNIVLDLEMELNISGCDFWEDVVEEAKRKDNGDYLAEIRALEVAALHTDKVDLEQCDYLDYSEADNTVNKGA